MLRIYLLLIISILTASIVLCQNLIPNPGFEEFQSNKRPYVAISRPDDIGNYLVGWYSPTPGTPDIYTSDPELKGRDIYYELYKNAVGNAYTRFGPRTGNYYVGILTYIYYPNLGYAGREYIQAKLLQPLVIGKLYYAEMYVLLRPTRSSIGGVLNQITGSYLSNIGFFFSADSIGLPKYTSTNLPIFNALPLLRQPQIVDTTYVSSFGCWHKISGYFRADKNYSYVTIGNFYDDNYSVVTNPKLKQERNIYYFIDDVKLVEVEQATTPTEYPCLGAERTLCFGETLTFTLPNTTGTQYRWQDGSISPNYTVDQPGTYFVTATTGQYSVTDSIRVTIEPPVHLPADTVLCQGETLTLAPYYPVKRAFQWSDGSQDSTLTVSQAGTYSVRVPSAFCNLTDTITVRYEDCPGAVPNVFTPNGDGKNDAFVIPNIESRPWRLEVYNRWGKRVYQALPYANDWRAEDVPSGLYYYGLFNEDLKRTIKGWVNVIKDK